MDRLVGTPTGRVIHSAVVADSGDAHTMCGRTLSVGWQEFDDTTFAPTCAQCRNPDPRA